MEENVATSSRRGTAYREREGGMAERELPMGYGWEGWNSVSRWFGDFGSFVYERPLVLGTIIIGFIGAIAGTRFAQMQASRQRRMTYERAFETLGFFSTLFPSFFGRRRGAFMDASRMMGGMTGTQGFRPGMRKGTIDTIRQIGYALSLIPVFFAFLRNPLIRDIGFRLVSRRVRRGWYR